MTETEEELKRRLSDLHDELEHIFTEAEQLAQGCDLAEDIPYSLLNTKKNKYKQSECFTKRYKMTANLRKQKKITQEIVDRVEGKLMREYDCTREDLEFPYEFEVDTTEQVELATF